MNTGKSGSICIAGGGIGGIQASLDLAEAGFRVTLVEKSPTIGGIMAQLDKTFPTNDCAMCIMSPKLVDCARHLNIDLHTCSEIEGITGSPGNFTVMVRKRARYVNEEKCTGCNECSQVCPVTRPNAFDCGLGERKAIYRPFPQAAPNVFTIEKKGKSPCSAACPAGCNAHGYVALIRSRKFAEAAALIREDIPLPAICGRVCGFCETDCSREHVDAALQIRALKRFAAAYEKEHGLPVPEKPAAGGDGMPVAIIGSGPAGLTAAYDLAGLGYKPVIFEALPRAGGMLRVGIPAYRLPDDVLDYEIGIIQQAGVEIRTNNAFGADLTLQALTEQGFKAVFLATGTHRSASLGIEGEELAGVIPGIEFLRDPGSMNSRFKGKRVAVIGGGNTAVDAARSALRLGAAEVHMIYRRSVAEMPVNREEREAAEAEGIRIHFLAAPARINGKNGKAEQLICNRMQLGFPDDSGRRRPIPAGGAPLTFDVDVVIPAIGQQLDDTPLQAAARDITLQLHLIKVDPVTLETSLPGVFAGGDAAGAGGFVVHAIAHGHAAAVSIDRYLKQQDLKKNREVSPFPVADLPAYYQAKKAPVPLRMIDAQARQTTFTEVEQGFTEEEAVQEAGRCLDCGVCCECLQCVSACKAGAIDHTMQEQVFRVQAGAVLLAPGCELVEAANLYKLGFGRYADVVTSLQFERILSASGPLGGHVKRLSDGKTPRRIAFIQCAGSRDPSMGNIHCSSVCCMYAIKEAIIAREHLRSVEPTIFYMDIRSHGKDFERFYNRAKNEYGVKFKKARVSGVVRDEATGEMIVQYEDAAGHVSGENFDLVILSVGFQGNGQLRELGDKLGLPLNRFGFIASDTFFPVQSKLPGVFLFGPAQEPRDIPETVMQASAAAASAAEILADSRFTEVQAKEYPPEKDMTGVQPRIGVFVCHCGINIGGTVRVPEVVQYAQKLPGVVYTEENLYTCSQDTQEHIKEVIAREDLNRVIVASCTPRTHEPLFQETIREAGLNRHLFSMANIRDQCSWIHMQFPDAATEKACDLVRMAIAKARLIEPLPRMQLDVVQSALVIGGGPAGMGAALSLSRQGYKVDLVEKEKVLGGNLRKVLSTIEGEKTAGLLDNLINELTGNPLVRIHLGAVITAVEGFVGNFKTTITSSNDTVEISHGAAIIATGASEAVPVEFGYGTDKRICTNLEFEQLLAGSSSAELPGRVAFIQCVGSRNEQHVNCSRICCRESIKNAILLKKRRPGAEVAVLYRDIRTYGFSEIYYQEARDLGVLFLRYEQDRMPELAVTPGGIRLTMHDLCLDRPITWEADQLVLAARIDPNPGNEQLSQYFKVPLNADRFFLEAHVKLRPVDFATEGVFLAGMAHSPKTIAESITQGKAAAGRAAVIISRDKYEAEATIAAVNEDLCDGCAVCVNVCEYKALEVVEKSEGIKIVQLNEAVCKGCGGCVAACPSGAMEQKGFKNEQILAEIDAALL